jgi:hypothetical protein
MVKEAYKEKTIEQKTTTTAFILVFPTLLLAGMAALFAEGIWARVLVTALGIYQLLMFKKFIEDYYNK